MKEDLGVAPGDGRRAVACANATEAVPPRAARDAALCRQQPVQDEEPPHLGLVNRLGELWLWDRLGQVDQRAVEARDWHVIDRGAVHRVERSRAVDEDAGALMERSGRRYLDRSLGRDQRPQRARRRVAQDGVRAAREDSRPLPSSPRERRAAYGVNTAMKGM